ncbi:MAG: MFS transporter [Fusobacteriaceae bacterium]
MFKSLTNLRKHNKNIKSSFVVNFLSTFIMQGIFLVFIGIYVKDLGYGEGNVGKILAVNNISVAIGSLLMAYIMMHYSRKTALTFGFFSMSIGMYGISFFNSIGSLIFFSSIIGMGFGFPLTAIGVLLTENSKPKERVDIFSTNFIIQSLGGVLGSYFGGKITSLLNGNLGESRSIPILFFICATILLGAIFPIQKLEEKKEVTHKKRKNLYSNLHTLMRGKTLGYLIYNTVIGFGAGLVVPFFSVYLKFALNIDDSWVGNIMALSQVGLVIGGLLVPYVSKKLGKVKTVIICQLLSIPFLISIAFPTGLLIVGISFLIRSTLMNLNQPLIQNISMEIVSDELRPLMSSLSQMTSYLTRALSVLLAGYLMENYSYNTPYYFTVILYLLSTYLFYKSFYSMNQKES